MDKFEELASSRPTIHIIFIHNEISDHFGGLLLDGDIYINDHLGPREKYQVLHEELAHYDYTVGDISHYSNCNDCKQEKLARSVAMMRAVTLDGLIYCYEHNLWTSEDIADYFGVTEEYLYQAIINYRTKYGQLFKHHDYWFDLRQTLSISKEGFKNG
ncbi:ImmA/IrrE family metallo-endopeptidase [Limosilactobacillus mucosae]|uniref:ImmA/IrrE family metallo-endopeptidase n=1 Tax=Limosilactobacillus mucosae TaxID=97478 RepID=UPI0040393147